MIKHRLLSVIIVICTILSAYGQDQLLIEDLYRDGNTYFYFEDYEEALAIYLDIYNHYPNNANLDYRIGICYLNIPGSKRKAIPFLERASKNISRRYNETAIRETRAPIETIFYLGNAYFSDNQLEKANETYELFRKQIQNEKQYDMEYFNHQVEGLNRSKLIQKYPVNHLRSNLGENINNRFANFNPVISGDGKTLAYTTRERFYQAIYVVRKDKGVWGRPQNITLDLVVEGNSSTLSLSFAGDELYLFKEVDHVGNIYVSNFKNDRWSPIRKLNHHINTDSYETHASISADGRKLYFTSNRLGGYGDLDIYVSERTKGGDWGPAVNLGPNINTRFDENTPFITTNGKTLFFSSEGHNSMGGYDVFFSQLQNDGSWSKPVNIGYPINTTDDDLFYHPINDGSIGLMAGFDSNGFGDKDIYQIEIFLPRYQRNIIASNDLYKSKNDPNQKTLVIDTVNVAGIALLDPSRPDHSLYLGPNSRHTLFFEGKAYNVADQSKMTQAIAESLTPLKTDEPIISPLKQKETEQISVRKAAEPVTLPKTQTAEIPAHEDDIHTPLLSDSDYTSIATIFNDSIENNLTPIAEDLYESSLEISRFNQLLLQLASDAFKPKLLTLFETEVWRNPSRNPRIQADRISTLADSTETTVEQIKLFTDLIDLTSIVSIETRNQFSRKIKQTSLNEDFYFKVQKLKRKSSSGLAALIDEAILNQHKIMSFKALWDFLWNERFDKTLPHLNELLVLTAELGIESYNSLTNEQKDEILERTKALQTPINGLLLTSIISTLLFIIIVIFLRRRKQKNRKK
jgi:tetratricopeptide (TPR) repeat protein